MSFEARRYNRPRILPEMKKIAIVSSCGGHLTEVRLLRRFYEPYEFVYVVDDHVLLPQDMEGRTLFATHSERDLRFFVNLWEAWRILRAYRPSVILSTGAGPVVPFAIIGKLFFGVRVVFIETITRVRRPSHTGRLMYWLTDEFFYQWDTLARFFPKGRCLGTLI